VIDDAIGLHVGDGGSGPSIRLVDGARFFLLHPDPAAITPDVLSHSLSQLCRFTGHVGRFYSVAEHCVMVSRVVPPEHAMAGLMHDASEAFIGDISRPLKVLLDQLAPDVIRDVEDRIHAAIAVRFGFDFPHVPEIKAADNVALGSDPLQGLPDPLPERIVPLGPAGAETAWRIRFAELGGTL
jgi:hypothetical protein